MGDGRALLSTSKLRLSEDEMLAARECPPPNQSDLAYFRCGIELQSA